jgi:lipid-binding SYLF domain-containing protein
VAGLTLASLAPAPRPVSQEMRTVESAGAVLKSFTDAPRISIPRALLHDAAGVAVVPHIVKAGLIVSERFGRGVVLVNEGKGRWSHPIFITLSGTGVGGQVGVEKSDLVLVFKTRKSLDRALSGKLTMGGDVTVAAGPVGRDAELASDRPLRADIISWSHSRGLFVGLSLEGARIHIDEHANEAFYGKNHRHPVEVFAIHAPMAAPVENLKGHLQRMCAPPPAPLPPAYAPPPPVRR